MPIMLIAKKRCRVMVEPSDSASIPTADMKRGSRVVGLGPDSELFDDLEGSRAQSVAELDAAGPKFYWQGG